MNDDSKRAGAVPESEAPWLSVVLPCYNEAQVIVETHRRVTAVCTAVGKPYELIFVNDGSEDQTWSQLRRLSEADPRLVAVNLSRNHGHQLALSAGLHFARGERVLIMDADLQDPPELLFEMLRKMDEGAEVVYAQRRSRPGDAPLKRLCCALYYRLLRAISDTQVPLDAGDFRLISRRVRDLIVAIPERRPFIRGLVSWLGLRQEAVFYDRDARFAGESKYPLRKLLGLGIDGIVCSGVRPLRFAALVGGGAIGLGVLLAAYALLSWLFVGATPRGWTSLLVVVVLLGGAQLLVLGILGEYLARIYQQTRGLPLFVVESVISRGGRPRGEGEGPGASRAPTAP